MLIDDWFEMVVVRVDESAADIDLLNFVDVINCPDESQ